MYENPEQQELDRKAVELQVKLNQEIENIGKIIDEMRKILTTKRGGEKNSNHN